MYKQTDHQVAVYKWATDTQTGEYGEYNVMKKWGCLYASLLYLTEEVTKRLYSPSQVKLLYDYLVVKGFMRNDMYVKNHEEVIRAGLRVLGYEPVEVRYHGKRTSSMGKRGNYHLEQIETPLGNGHFRHEDWDPYSPGIPAVRVLTYRDYTITI